MSPGPLTQSRPFHCSSFFLFCCLLSVLVAVHLREDFIAPEHPGMMTRRGISSGSFRCVSGYYWERELEAEFLS